MSGKKKESANQPYVRAVERSVEIIKAFEKFPNGATLSDIALAVDLDRATARRFLLTLARLGYVRQEKRTFHLAPRILELGLSYFATMPIWEVSQPFLDQYCEETKGTISIGVLDDTEVVYVARAQSRRSVYAINVTIGSRFPSYSTSIGRVLLAWQTKEFVDELLSRIDLVRRTPKTIVGKEKIKSELARVRGAGYSISDQETEIGIRSIAIPLRNRNGGVVAALNTSFQVSFASRKDLKEVYLPALRDVATKIETLNLLPGGQR